MVGAGPAASSSGGSESRRKVAPDIEITVRGCALDLGPSCQLPLHGILPRLVLMSPLPSGANASGCERHPPLVPHWHVTAPPAPTARTELNAQACSCICSTEAAANPGCSGSGVAAGSQEIVAERQWRRAEGQCKQPEVLLLDRELLALSHAKLRNVEQLSRWSAEDEDWLEIWRNDSARTVDSETARRIPIVKELLSDAGPGPIEAQICALQLEVDELAAERQQDQVRVRMCEREVGLGVAAACAEHHAKEAKLCCQLEEERATTLALEALVNEQAMAIAQLRRERRAGALQRDSERMGAVRANVSG
eukprot:NODE_15454_length_1049_cov_4.876356.p1 GENE.NODE_15454_length_1049_cov_4.876356~~NODE_15454_length_1049_cov_4.876356.p1  ORF type:complete len:348 (+),score=89.28 NODE_15454_length_1049_cov_4.876356:121-1044(+)